MPQTTLSFTQLDEGLRNDLKSLAAVTVRNQILCERFLATLGVSIDEIGATAREIDAELAKHTDWQNRFPCCSVNTVARDEIAARKKGKGGLRIADFALRRGPRSTG
jgi:hypothetical protein